MVEGLVLCKQATDKTSYKSTMILLILTNFHISAFANLNRDHLLKKYCTNSKKQEIYLFISRLQQIKNVSTKSLMLNFINVYVNCSSEESGKKKSS